MAEQHSSRIVILGTDWWTDCDDVAAVRIACRLAQQGVWTLAGVILNACMPDSAASLDGFMRTEGVAVPIGIDTEAIDFGRKPPYQQLLAAQTGSKLTNADCEAGVRLYRRLLAAQPDGAVELIEIGYLQMLAALLASPPDDISPLDGRTLVAQKVRMLWIMGGNWENDGRGRENNFSRNQRAVAGAQAVFTNYPGEICILGYEVGVSVMTRPPTKEDDLLYMAYCAHNAQAERSSWDPMLVLMAAESPAADAAQLASSGYAAVRGRAEVGADGGNSFTPSPNGLHRYVKKLYEDQWYAEKIDALLR